MFVQEQVRAGGRRTNVHAKRKYDDFLQNMELRVGKYCNIITNMSAKI